MGSRRWRQEQAREKAQAEVDKAAREAEFDASCGAIIELVSDPKTRIPPRRRYNHDPERQEFVQDELDFEIEQMIENGAEQDRGIGQVER